ncbi:MAG: NADH:ubiquinone oxidoreductase subunit N, partial [Gammaproteobacteria bacterium]|nr:NADH:ubiquinone oxidoreductase subunit N [Gammaproteobacteria bacterium]
KVIFFDQPDVDTPLEAGMDMKIALSINGLAMIVLGVFPTLILGYCIQVFS